MSQSAPAAVQAAVDRVIEQHGELGIQLAVYQGRHLAFQVCAGVAEAESRTPMTPDTLFPVFSATKAVTATAVHLQVDRGRLDYARPIAADWAEFAAHGKARVPVMDVLTYRAGIPQMPDGVTPETMCDWDAMVRAVADLSPLWEPGTRTGYHAYTFGWMLGKLVRRTDPFQRDFGQFVRDEVCAPLGIDDIWLGGP